MNKIPAYGFESTRTPVPAREREVEKQHLLNQTGKAIKELMKTKIFVERSSDPTSLYDKDPQEITFTHATEEEHQEILKEQVDMENFLKILGYFPFIGTLCGIRRLADNLLSPEGRKAHSYHNIERGILETLSLGVVNLPVDLIVYFRNKNQEQEGTNGK